TVFRKVKNVRLWFFRFKANTRVGGALVCARFSDRGSMPSRKITGTTKRLAVLGESPFLLFRFFDSRFALALRISFAVRVLRTQWAHQKK
ncbi:MAG: hypothetical protein LH470_02480, partial [Lysobacter sp.]|nr:hypothetical protein [Lysobacter sp.]